MYVCEAAAHCNARQLLEIERERKRERVLDCVRLRKRDNRCFRAALLFLNSVCPVLSVVLSFEAREGSILTS